LNINLTIKKECTLSHKQFLIDKGEINSSFEKSDVVVLQAGYEHTSSYGRGSANGPKEIINASHYVEYYDEELGLETINETNIHTAKALEFGREVHEEALSRIERKADEIIKSGKFLITLGGEHTISFPIFKAFQNNYPNLSILQLDAHADLRESYEGSRFSHACVMARIRELNPKIAQYGVRALSKIESELIETDKNIQTVYAHNLVQGKVNQDHLLRHLTEDVYVTIDADAFDPSVIPGTGTPEPGGLKWYETLQFLKRVFTEKNVVGFDVVECCPREGENISEFTLAKLVYKLIGYRYLNKFSEK
jgi:agmatinase